MPPTSSFLAQVLVIIAPSKWCCEELLEQTRSTKTKRLLSDYQRSIQKASWEVSAKGQASIGERSASNGERSASNGERSAKRISAKWEVSGAGWADKNTEKFDNFSSSTNSGGGCQQPHTMTPYYRIYRSTILSNSPQPGIVITGMWGLLCTGFYKALIF